ncbi:MAG: cyclic nucleotide-binding domain-containing protein, partial [Mariprofundaceae bacterium]|nr:cyclic nucleotide-binding domain-containing protein [Mariprofundaceae bacterium]
SFRPGQPIITEGQREHAFLVLCSGDATVEIEGKQIGVIDQGGCVGEAGFLLPIDRFATVKARSDVSAVKVEGAIMDWASIPVQMRFNKAFQKTLIERLIASSRELAEWI